MSGYAIKVYKPAEDPEAIAIERREAFEVVMLARRVAELAPAWSDDHKQAFAAHAETVAKEILDAARFVRQLVPQDWIPQYLRADSNLPLFVRKQAGHS